MRNAEKDAVEKAYAARGSVERAPWMLTVYAGYEF